MNVATILNYTWWLIIEKKFIWYLIGCFSPVSAGRGIIEFDWSLLSPVVIALSNEVLLYQLSRISISIIQMQDHKNISFLFHSGISQVCCQFDLKTCHYVIKRNVSLQIIIPQSEHHTQEYRLKSIERWVWVSNYITSLHTGGCTWWLCCVKLFYIRGRWHSNGHLDVQVLAFLPQSCHTITQTDWLTETETRLFNTTWHYTDAWYQTYMIDLMYYSVLTWYQILACMFGDLC